IKAKLPQAFIIAGNVGTPEGVIDLENWGADATKVGIGPGKVCITRLKTGFGTGGWQLSALKWCARVATKPIIADGGIRHHGDIAKSVRFGAAMVMVGSLFAGHENPLAPPWRWTASSTRSTTARPATSTRASTSMWKASAFGAREGQAGRHLARDARGLAKLHLLRRRPQPGGPAQGQLCGAGR
ncbi:Inosine-5'-monophosphate dehydrogenase-like protein, partial [Daphnia magna]